MHELEETELKIAETDIQCPIPFPTPSKPTMPEPDSVFYSATNENRTDLRDLVVNPRTPMDALGIRPTW